MHVTCGTDIELTCPIRFLKKSEQVVSERAMSREVKKNEVRLIV